MRQTLRERHGARFVPTVDARDEIVFHLRDTYRLSRLEAHAMYLKHGDGVFEAVCRVLADLRRPLPHVDSFLDFACGYGRITRFLVTSLPPSRVTVSDISHDAVDFVRATFGVRGFYSAADPVDVQHDGRYAVVLVNSLFTHLSIGPWRAWLRSLSRLLAQDGVLLFTVRGPNEIGRLDDMHRARTTLQDDGFQFGDWNETRGRLAGEYYGTTYVTDEFIRRTVALDDLGTVLGPYLMPSPTVLLYVLRR